MGEPEKPFACPFPDCGMTFTNEDHLTVHTKKHDMYLQLGLEQKAAFVADQTPTPTRFIRNCEEVGLFQDLQNVNPFEEGFKRAMETCKHGLLSLENSMPTSTTDDLHTPQMVFPTLENADSTLYTSNNQKNITISRSSSDESGTIKEYETTTISKLTNEVTTISRVVNKHDVVDKSKADDAAAKTDEQITHTDVHNETSVSYTNNVIKIHNNIEIRKDNIVNVETAKSLPVNVTSYDSVIKDASIVTKDVLLANSIKTQIEPKLTPIMSQKSIDFVVDNLTSEVCNNNIKKPEVKIRNRKIVKQMPKTKPTASSTSKINSNINAKNLQSKKVDDYEVIIKLPNGEQVRMKAVDEIGPEKSKIENETKEKLKLAINNKVSQKDSVLQRLLGVPTPVHGIPISTGTLIPITILPTSQIVSKIPIVPFNLTSKPSQEFKKTVKRKTMSEAGDKIGNCVDKATNNADSIVIDDIDDCVIVEDAAPKKRSKEDQISRVEASRRYRVKLRESMKKQVNEIKRLREANERLAAEKAILKLLITEHMKKCPNAEDIRRTQEKLARTGTSI